MQDVIRLVCPECDAVHRVKNITLGKLYRCKKCKSGLITMTPAVLTCPTCGASKPPSHIEVSRLITCEECEEAPLMNVRFAQNGKGRLTQEASSNKFDTDIRPPEDEPHARQTAHFDPPLPQRANLDRPRKAQEPLPEDMPPPLEAMPDSPAPRKMPERNLGQMGAIPDAAPEMLPADIADRDDPQDMQGLADSPEISESTEQMPRSGIYPAPLPAAAPASVRTSTPTPEPVSEPEEYAQEGVRKQGVAEAARAQSAQGTQELPVTQGVSAPAPVQHGRRASPPTRNALPDDLTFEEDSPEPEEDDQVALTSANDTVMLKQMGQELLDKASRTLADSYRA